MKFSKEHVNSVIVISAFIIILSASYYFFYALPKFNQQKLNFEKEKYEQEQKMLEEKQKIELDKINEENERKERELKIKETEFQNKQEIIKKQEDCKNLIPNYVRKVCLDKWIDMSIWWATCTFNSEEEKVLKSLQQYTLNCDKIQ